MGPYLWLGGCQCCSLKAVWCPSGLERFSSLGTLGAAGAGFADISQAPKIGLWLICAAARGQSQVLFPLHPPRPVFLPTTNRRP